jgi:hypothetical protein
MFENLKVGDRVKTLFSGMATVIQVGCYNGTMVKLKCDNPKWYCPYFYKHELDLKDGIYVSLEASGGK